MEKFDKSKPYGTCVPPTEDGGHYVQNDILYDHDGEPLENVKPGAKPLKKSKAGKKPNLDKTVANGADGGTESSGDGKPELGPIDTSQKWFALQTELAKRFGKKPKNKAEALRMIEDAGLMP